jgi:flavin-dependent thymidylate synthase
VNVELVSYTENALEILLYTKDTRLQGDQTLQDVISWPESKKMDHLAYMRDTIKSSWEFVDYIFKISGVSRAFTHQLVRTRNASYAQEAQRAVDVSSSEWITPDKYDEDLTVKYDQFMGDAIDAYQELINSGMQRQDARGVIPTNIATSIMMKANLRTLHNMAELRLCYKAQGEYQQVFRAMKELVVSVHPWADDFINVFCANHGTCCFPNFTECPIQTLTYNAPHNKVIHNQVRSAIKQAHSETKFEANPVAMGGKA